MKATFLNRRAIERQLGNRKSHPPSTTLVLVSIPMPSEKRSRKRHKAGKLLSSRSKLKLVTPEDDGDLAPLGSNKRVWEDEDKDDEERRLESVLFGKPYVPSSKGRAGGESGEGDEDMPEADIDLAGNEFANLMDSEVRHIHERR